MEYKKLCESDYSFMCVIWEHEPVNSTELVRLCAERFGWKKSTTYTMVKKMCEKGLAKSEHATVTALVPRDMAEKLESDFFVRRTFSGSLPGFLVAFLDGKRLSKEEADELRRLIDEHME